MAEYNVQALLVYRFDFDVRDVEAILEDISESPMPALAAISRGAAFMDSEAGGLFDKRPRKDYP